MDFEKNWKEIHPDFTEELQKEWENKGFNYDETKEWINIGLTVNDANYAFWLKNIAKENPKNVLNYRNEQVLREQYAEYLKNATIQERNLSQTSLGTINVSGGHALIGNSFGSKLNLSYNRKKVKKTYINKSKLT